MKHQWFLPAEFIGEHLHVYEIDGGIDHHPGPAPELCVWWYINKHRAPVLPQGIHDVGAELEDLVVHICGGGSEYI